ncbi:sigma-70 family RNA polymerase sigma factor [Synechococcus sp. CS-1331]|uniref:sigma-70 family RNA polymerase sigma factor n=1 Tax=Synechococcus sp. CS-1331 TaxID=2847973 RepID=UPI00199F62D6|nr:sigma-70 family RNA polymerase sigma factor [Synechococcus sp. CS-1331]MCT0228461.1 sigma-70 family RNA polymerase sigma factor [Synechococcus sp. CS-1331]NQW37632.1 sigma-70 family RNA polymerase sigma factor [Cyanobacteria bacterium bin.275]
MPNKSRATAAPTAAQRSQAHLQRNQRVDQYRTLVTPIAVHYGRRCPEPIEDLIQVGLLGLLRAAELFDAQTQTPFEAFARPHIRGAILHYLRDSALAVRLPRRQMELHDKLRQVQANWHKTHGQEASSEDLRRALDLSIPQWQELQRGKAMARPIGLADGVIDAWVEQVVDREAGSAQHGSAQQPGEDGEGEYQLRVKRQWARLEPDLRQVVDKVVLSGWTYRRTAALLKVSPMTVQRRLKRGLAELRQGLGRSANPPISSQLSSPISYPSCRHHGQSAAPAC